MRQFEATYKGKDGSFTVPLEATGLANARTIAEQEKPKRTQLVSVREVRQEVTHD